MLRRTVIINILVLNVSYVNVLCVESDRSRTPPAKKRRQELPHAASRWPTPKLSPKVPVWDNLPDGVIKDVRDYTEVGGLARLLSAARESPFRTDSDLAPREEAIKRAPKNVKDVLDLITLINDDDQTMADRSVACLDLAMLRGEDAQLMDAWREFVPKPQEMLPYTKLVCIQLGLHRGIFTGRLKTFESLQNAVRKVMVEVNTLRDQIEKTRDPIARDRVNVMHGKLEGIIHLHRDEDDPVTDDEVSGLVSRYGGFTLQVRVLFGNAKNLSDQDARTSVTTFANGLLRDWKDEWVQRLLRIENLHQA